MTNPTDPRTPQKPPEKAKAEGEFDKPNRPVFVEGEMYPDVASRRNFPEGAEKVAIADGQVEAAEDAVEAAKAQVKVAEKALHDAKAKAADVKKDVKAEEAEDAKARKEAEKEHA